MEYSIQLSSRLDEVLANSKFPVVVGGDCSVLIASGLALKRRGRYGLVFLDAHSDFRHLQNSETVEAAAGEDLAISLGYGDPSLINLSGKGPNFLTGDVAIVGVRDSDEHLDELGNLGVFYITSSQVAGATDHHLQKSIAVVTRQTDGFWVHIDFDVVDAGEMYAADCPEPNGISFSKLAYILRGLVKHDRCIGVELTIYDPDLDASGICARRIVKCLRYAFSS